MQIHTPTVVQGGRGLAGVDGTPPQSFGYVAVFQTDFALESLWSSQQDEVYFMGVGIAGGL